MDKCFQNHIRILAKKLYRKDCFAFNRFSDGELFILKNQELELSKEKVQVGNKVTKSIYQKEDFKHFSPLKHSFYREKLIDSFIFEHEDYYRGISCRCCVGVENFNYQIKLLKSYNNKGLNLTWSNLFLNSNYPFFINFIFPVFSEYKCVIICNENADISRLPFIVADFRVGHNAMINDYSLIENISDWIKAKKIKNHLFLFSASTFSKFAIHQLFSSFPTNTYIDIGTTINPLLNMRSDRTYLRQFWLGEKGSDLDKICVW